VSDRFFFKFRKCLEWAKSTKSTNQNKIHSISSSFVIFNELKTLIKPNFFFGATRKNSSKWLKNQWSTKKEKSLVGKKKSYARTILFDRRETAEQRIFFFW
jgi:hypothetical protein